MPTNERTPAYGLTVLANVKPGRVDELRAQAARIAALPLQEVFRPLTLHYARWVLVNNDTQFLYIAIFDTDFDQYIDDVIDVFRRAGVGPLFSNLEGFPEDWETNPDAVKRFMREHHYESLFEYSEYPGVTVKEIEQALTVRNALATMLDAMQ